MSRVEGEHTDWPVTERSLDVRALVGDDRDLTLFVEKQPRVFPVPDDLDVLTMARLLKLETDMNNVDETTDDFADRYVETLEKANDEIANIVLIRTPDAPALDPLGVKAIAGVLAWIAGDLSVADAVAKAITAGRSPAKDADGVATPDSSVPLDEAEARRDESGPLASSRPSPTPSSGSDESTDGARSGGEDAPGERSASTLPTPTAA